MNKTNTNTAETTIEMKKIFNQRTPAPTKKALNLLWDSSDTDVNGSYTGKPKDKNEIPVQDADDL